MKKILCPTDFSPIAQTAVAYAASLAKSIHCQLTLLNVQSVYDYMPAKVTLGQATTLAGISDRLQIESEKISRTFDIDCHAEVESTSSGLSSVIQVKGKGHDLVVMGSEGPDDLYQFFAGSKTYRAMVKSEAPLLMVPAGYTYHDIKTMVYAFDYLHEKNLPLTRLIPIIRALQCELTILQVVKENHNKEAEDDLKELQFIVRNFYGDDIAFRYDRFRSSEIAQSINHYVLQNEPDALALCSVNRNVVKRLFHKSVIKEITAYCQYPVFVFHP